MKIVTTEDVRGWYSRADDLAACLRSIGARSPDGEYLERVMGMPPHLSFLVTHLAAETNARVPAHVLESIPFHSLCRGLFLPLSGMAADRAAALFGFPAPPPPDTAAREKLLRDFLDKPVGLPLEQRLGCILGDPFLGRRGTFRRDSLIRLLLSVRFVKRRDVLDRLTVVGDVAALFAESRTALRGDPPLTAAEVLGTLARLPGAPRSTQFEVLRSLLSRCGKLEAYFLAKLVLRKAGFGFDYQGPLLASVVASKFGADAGQVAQAIALTDVFTVVGKLADTGPAGLREIRLKPLVPVRPALASATVDNIKRFPVWVERKYDGVRLMLHKSTDASGAVLCGAYTRNRHDWLELVPGLDATIRMLPARDVILDGELHGTVLDLEGLRQASVYEVHASLQGEPVRAVQLKYAAFDLVYLNGRDLTGLPLSERRRQLGMLVGPMAGVPVSVPVGMAEGQSAAGPEDLNRLYHHFRAQGYEGIIAKDPAGPYRIADRDPSWTKRKPAVTLDLVLLGAVLAVTTKENAGTFGSYVIGARRPEGGFEDIGDVAGVDKERDAALCAEIFREGLMTGRRIERPSMSGVRPGYELRPDIVATVRFEGITRDTVTGRLSLRDPKLVVIRSDKTAAEADTVRDIEELYLRQRVG
jgi:DNA ligase-1